jgi:hypothetical protein
LRKNAEISDWSLEGARLNRLLKNTRFVSGHRFSDAVPAAKSVAPSGAAGRNITFSAARSSRALSKLQRHEFFRKLFERCGQRIVWSPALAAEVEVFPANNFPRNHFSRAKSVF